jgi:hypothetical protein
MQLSNVRRIIIEDFPEEQRETVGKIATIVNPFMEEVVELSRKRVNYDNMARSLVTIDITVDETGKPKGMGQINIGLPSYSGKTIVHIQSLSGGDNVVSTPYLDCQYQGNGVVKINKFFGLPANKKVRVSIEFIA